jgi:hypothetical protein
MPRPPRKWAAGRAVGGLLGCGPAAASIMTSRATLGSPPEGGAGLAVAAIGVCATLDSQRLGGRCRRTRRRPRRSAWAPPRGAAWAAVLAWRSWRCPRLLLRRGRDGPTRCRQLPLRRQRGRHVQPAFAVGADPDLDARHPCHEGLRTTPVPAGWERRAGSGLGAPWASWVFLQPLASTPQWRMRCTPSGSTCCRKRRMNSARGRRTRRLPPYGRRRAR